MPHERAREVVGPAHEEARRGQPRLDEQRDRLDVVARVTRDGGSCPDLRAGGRLGRRRPRARPAVRRVHGRRAARPQHRHDLRRGGCQAVGADEPAQHPGDRCLVGSARVVHDDDRARAAVDAADEGHGRGGLFPRRERVQGARRVVVREHRLDVDVQRPAAAQPDGERVVVAVPERLAVARAGRDRVERRGVDGTLDAPARQAAEHGAVGADRHRGADRARHGPRRGDHRRHGEGWLPRTEPGASRSTMWSIVASLPPGCRRTGVLPVNPCGESPAHPGRRRL